MPCTQKVMWGSLTLSESKEKNLGQACHHAMILLSELHNEKDEFQCCVRFDKKELKRIGGRNLDRQVPWGKITQAFMPGELYGPVGGYLIQCEGLGSRDRVPFGRCETVTPPGFG